MSQHPVDGCLMILESCWEGKDPSLFSYTGTVMTRIRQNSREFSFQDAVKLLPPMVSIPR